MRLWSRIFAWGYDSFTRASEKAGMSDIRAGLVSQASGRTLEIGPGPATTCATTRPRVTELVLSEPSPFMAAKLRAKLEREASVVDAPPRTSPSPTTTSTPWSAPRPLHRARSEASLAEIARVLKPGRRLLFAEHVRSADPKIARARTAFVRPWRAFGDGCNCNRDTLATLEASPLSVEEVEHGKLPKAPSLVEPLITGSARAA